MDRFQVSPPFPSLLLHLFLISLTMTYSQSQPASQQTATTYVFPPGSLLGWGFCVVIVLTVVMKTLISLFQNTLKLQKDRSFFFLSSLDINSPRIASDMLERLTTYLLTKQMQSPIFYNDDKTQKTKLIKFKMIQST